MDRSRLRDRFAQIMHTVTMPVLLCAAGPGANDLSQGG
jgi:hypothetical protein